MADSNSQSLQIMQGISDSQVASYAVVAALALLTYDTLLTLPDEINYIWCSHRWGIPSILYFMARSGCFIELVSLIIPVNSFTLVVIYLFYDGTHAKLQQGMRSGAMTSIGVHGLLLARVYAIAQGNRNVKSVHVVRWQLLLVGFLYVTIFVLNCIRMKAFQCNTSNSDIFSSLDFAFTIVVIGLVFDVSILAITLQHTWCQWRFTIKSGLNDLSTSGTSFSGLLLSQGVIRFFLISAWSLEGAINLKTVRVKITLSGVDGGLENASVLMHNLKDFVDI
ncbi:hypothetical protein M422DRAFT_48152 [Sphaerobolus stellatus SS14]|uniref:DUF6533 domain-containing protein n=1 Tax=Sphaerobolus stellatus (strain SS14) TaxID=990650 RepID=A0A0C9VW03_SPHS4|nr:hypothetical protein M422DRAFT_48152 [Sphaerobolus stellatus SS14]